MSSQPVVPDIATGLGYHQRGDLARAETVYRAILAADPAHANALHLLGVIAYQRGDHPSAIELISRAIAAAPDAPDFHVNLGNAQKDSGHPEAAIASYRRAIELRPDHAAALCNLGNVLQDRGRLEESIDCYRRALSARPDYPEALNSLGTALQQQGRNDEALACFRDALRLDSAFAEALNNLAGALQLSGDLEGAVAAYRECVARNPAIPEVHHNLGKALHQKGDLDAAAASYRETLRLKPNYLPAYNDLAVVLRRNGKNEEALQCLRRAVELDPAFADGHYNLGLVLHEAGRPEAAIEHYRKAITLNPGFAGAYNDLGNVLHRLAREEEAAAAYRKAIEVDPDFAEAHYNLGLSLQEQARLDEAVGCFRRALELKPDFKDADGNLLFVLNYHPDIHPEKLFAEYRRWNEAHAAPLTARAGSHANDRSAARVLRVGYVSPDFRGHSAAPFIEPLLAHHHESRVEVHAYAEVAQPDAVTERFRNMVDRWTVTVGMSDEELAARVRADGIDILVDLAGHTANNRLLAFARKPAPVQVTWLGFGYTTGLEAMDYFFGDPYFVPQGTERYFSETVFRLPRTAFAYRPPATMPGVGPLPALRNGHLTFGCFSRTVRLNYKVIALWARLLQELPASRLVLNAKVFTDRPTYDLFRSRFAAHGVDTDRVHLVYTSPQPKTWEAYNKVDIALDPFPHNAGTTTFEALWMGVPVISLVDRPPLGRFGATILNNVGLPGWLAESPDGYIAVARREAENLDGLAELRAGLRERMLASPICDEEGFARAVEAAYREMWKKWCADGA